MNYVPLFPDEPPLAGRVELCFAFSDYAPEHARERLVPNGRTNLVIEVDGRERYVYDPESGARTAAFRSAWLSGVHARHIVIGDTDASSSLVVAQFVPGRALPFLHRRLDALADRVVPAEEILGAGVLELRETLRAEPDVAARPALLADWLAGRHDAQLEPPAVVTDTVDALLARPGDVVLTEFVAAHGGASYKHFVELFKRHVGPTPKTFQRILRFHAVFERLQDPRGVSWAELGLELGYADQAHFVRDFHAFSGYRPRTFVEAGHERLNFFPEPPR